MYQVRQITAIAHQEQTLVLPDGTQIGISMYYSTQQLGWFFTSITYGSFTLQGIRITTGADMLFQFRNQIPFGIAVTTADGQEPTQLQDFATGYATMYIIDSDEVEEYREYLQGGQP